MLSGIKEDLTLPILPKREIVHGGLLNTSITGRRVCVTGAGGSIGAELVMQIAASDPAALMLIDNSELNLYEINCTLNEANLPFNVYPALADVRESSKAIGHLFQEFKPDIVFHAAALKHVPLLENDNNLIEAVLTNVGGTRCVLQACTDVMADMVLVSTDKAVNPSSVMGLTKRVAEICMQAFQGTTFSRICHVRFGNVLGSSGSVVPMFRRQIAQGGPVTVTHPEMTRYMMTIRQAVDLMLNAATAHRKLPHGYCSLYVLDMGEPVKILELAEHMIRSMGLRPNVDIPVEIIGIRPGEKLSEELFYAWEKVSDVTPAGVRRVDPIRKDPMLDRQHITNLLIGAEARNAAVVKQLLVALVPEYTGKDIWL